MADSFIPVPGTSEKLQSYENEIAGEDVHAEAVVVVDESGSPIGPATAAKQSDLDKYSFQDRDETGTPRYYGWTAGSAWIIWEWSPLAGTMRYANLSNNPGVTDTYETVATGPWAVRATLVYDYLHNLTGV